MLTFSFSFVNLVSTFSLSISFQLDSRLNHVSSRLVSITSLLDSITSCLDHVSSQSRLDLDLDLVSSRRDLTYRSRRLVSSFLGCLDLAVSSRLVASHLVSSRVISCHLVSSRLVSSHLISSCLVSSLISHLSSLVSRLFSHFSRALLSFLLSFSFLLPLLVSSRLVSTCYSLLVSILLITSRLVFSTSRLGCLVLSCLVSHVSRASLSFSFLFLLLFSSQLNNSCLNPSHHVTSQRLVLAVLSRLSCRARSRPCCLFLSCLDSTQSLLSFFLSRSRLVLC